jgi:N-acetylglucosaminyldiphosphoundecaprenol N-acetyl-beta-D-mannosaminyltransferase
MSRILSSSGARSDTVRSCPLDNLEAMAAETRTNDDARPPARSADSRQRLPARSVPLPLSPSYTLSLVSLSPAEAAEKMAAVFQAPPPHQGPVTVAFMNMRNFVAARDDPAAIWAFASMDQIYPDGMGLQIARHLAGLPWFPRVSGTDTVPLLLRRLPVGTRIFLLGGQSQVVTAAASRFSRLFPQTSVVGFHQGFFPPADDDEVVAAIAASGADLLLVGMGSPLQEQWLARNRDRLPTRLAICVGGLFHYWAGDLHRAPLPLRSLGLEWLWILAQQPSKWRVYSLDAACFSLAVIRLKRRPQ